jgi:hypothetical protein
MKFFGFDGDRHPIQVGIRALQKIFR